MNLYKTMRKEYLIPEPTRKEIMAMTPYIPGPMTETFYFIELMMKVADGLTRRPKYPELFSYEADLIESAVIDGALPTRSLQLVRPIREMNY